MRLIYIITFITLISIGSTSEVTSSGNGDCYEHPRPKEVDKLSWSYEESMKGDIHGKCSPKTICGPSTWKNIIPTGSIVNECGGSAQSPIDLSKNIITDDIDTKPIFMVYNKGCKHWTSYVNDHVFKISFAEEDHLLNYILYMSRIMEKSQL
mmetsp:Transcript_416/g.429  ORF Transcript_416/g.429 Transcript_416/m.429 type:complete len:152 (+) Transcript_416:185-640(+)